MRYKNKTALVFDNGLFTELAVKLARDFGKVYYYMPWQSAYVKSNIMLPGKGLSGVTRVDRFFELLPELDIIVFPDVYEADLQSYLEKQGKRVWGSRHGDELELFRADSKKHMAKLGIDVGPWKLVKGIAELREYLKTHDDQYVKISRTRGDFETFHAETYEIVKPKLDKLEHQLGAKGTITEFIVEEAINDAVELAYDGWTIDGEFPKNTMVGIEVKDRGYVGKATRYADLPQPVKDVNQKLSPTLRDYGYRNFFAAEMRVTKDGKAYVIDPCCRLGAPPNEMMMEMVTNLSDIIWHGAMGEIVEPIFAAKWAAELLLISEEADNSWVPFEFPASIRDRVKLRDATRIDGTYYCVPQASGHPEIGAVVGMGDTMDDAIKDCRALAEKVKGYYVETFPQTLDDATEQIKKLKEFGIKF